MLVTRFTAARPNCDCHPGSPDCAAIGHRVRSALGTGIQAREDAMRITKIEDLHCNAGWRDFSFLKISTDEDVTGWSEFMESYGSEGLAGVIRKLGGRLIGWDPRPVEKITAYLHGVTRQSAGGIAQQAIAAIENALVDLKAKALGVPVYEMLGGPVRDRLQLYWSHCGTWRIS